SPLTQGVSSSRDRGYSELALFRIFVLWRRHSCRRLALFDNRILSENLSERRALSLPRRGHSPERLASPDVALAIAARRDERVQNIKPQHQAPTSSNATRRARRSRPQAYVAATSRTPGCPLGPAQRTRCGPIARRSRLSVKHP